MDSQYGYRRQAGRNSSEYEGDADCGAGAERWLISYADLITTLMVFFLALYVLQLAKTRDAEMRPLEAHASHDGVTATKADIANAVTTARDAARYNLLSELQTIRDRQQITVRSGSQGVEIAIDAGVLFNSGDARLLPASFDVLDELAAVMRKQPQNILVEGHTDSMPISNARYASNWELSSARAGAVVRFLVDRGVEPHRLAAVGRADNFPLLAGVDPVARSMNRRVTILVQY